MAMLCYVMSPKVSGLTKREQTLNNRSVEENDCTRVEWAMDGMKGYQRTVCLYNGQISDVVSHLCQLWRLLLVQWGCQSSSSL